MPPRIRAKTRPTRVPPGGARAGDDGQARPRRSPRGTRAPAGKPADPTRELGEVLDFMRLIWSLTHALDATSKKMAVSLGVTGPQRLTLRLVGRWPGATAGQVAAALHLHPSTLTGVIRRLDEGGLLVRERGSDDRREVRLQLSARGRLLDRRQTGTVEAAVRRVLSRSDPRRVAAAAALLGALEEELRRNLD